ncbi:hypothetical protein CBM2587_A160384 [Cupriavidus taiwanensis]|uniref:Uncharacterized protein n=1 Tax=Cupriavidus taiwanensis TaxID=164546 RepID=A0A375BJG5_9BURK|nr:hypothetical protein CBM2587_A160384 [Cupriavidus taiwanensis]
MWVPRAAHRIAALPSVVMQSNI